MTQRTVQVWGNPCELSVAQNGRGLWVVTGTYKGEKLEVKDKSEPAVLKRWKDAARVKGV